MTRLWNVNRDLSRLFVYDILHVNQLQRHLLQKLENQFEPD